MAKGNGLSSNVRLVLNAIIIVLLLGGVFAAWADHKGDTKAVDTKVDVHVIATAQMKEDGCDPSKKNTTDVAVLKSQLNDIREAQTDDKNEILRAIGSLRD